ncbi:ubiquinol oxidase subunit II [Buchnera aphidicola (Chaitoregma tattakana)]|uniref:ubiquinol oxidase subunit II n=1 Tax=Buchnera aphidicola TaxID=9 RepID=UPI0031B848BD
MIKNIYVILFCCISFFTFIFLEIRRKIMFSTYGYIRDKENHLILILFLIMLLVVVPVIIMTMYFMFKYNENNKNKKYCPNWNSSYIIESIIWIIPIIIVTIFSVISFNTTKSLDPSKYIQSNRKTIEINVISLDWCWLFIYPDYKIASINEVAIPTNTTVKFNITSSSVMNSFFVPNLGSQIYAMPGTKTKLYLITKHSGIYKGMSSNYSGYGFSNMKFTLLAFDSDSKFLSWINILKSSKTFLDNRKKFENLQIPKINRKKEYFSHVYPDLFENIINKFHCK